MLLTILMLCLAIACAAIGVWAMRRPPTEDGTGLAAPPRRDSGPVAEKRPVAADRAAIDRSAIIARDMQPTRPTNGTAVVEAGSIAFLDFEGALGRIHVERPEVVIGRHSQDDIRINDVRVSRHHAKLVAKRGGGFEIHNLTADRSEPNPMQINGETREHADIADGDVVTLGGVTFVFRRAA